MTLGTSKTPAATPACLPSGKPYSASAVSTKFTFRQRYGFFEARLRVPGRQGFLGAFWLHPASGSPLPEIDIMELVGGAPDELMMTAHYDDPAQPGRQSVGLRHSAPNLSDEFHIYGVFWQPGLLTFYLDGRRVGQMGPDSGAHFHNVPVYLILNTTVCAPAARRWCREPVPDMPWDAKTTMEVDWVRVWQTVP